MAQAAASSSPRASAPPSGVLKTEPEALDEIVSQAVRDRCLAMCRMKEGDDGGRTIPSRLAEEEAGEGSAKALCRTTVFAR